MLAETRALRARAAGLLRARAQRRHRTGDRASRTPRSACTPTTRRSTRAISSIRNSPGPFSATSTTACTITWSRCSSSHRRAGRRGHDAGGRFCSPTKSGREGPIPFRRFMEVALYHPEYGYYRRARATRSASSGDFFTAEQIQPVFGILMARADPPALRTPWEIAAGLHRGRTRRRPARDGGGIRGVDATCRWISTPANCREQFRGVVFSNEFFDALPVDAVMLRRRRVSRTAGDVRGRHVSLGRRRAVGEPVRIDYLRRFYPPPEEGRWYEVNLEALLWMERIAASSIRRIRTDYRLRLHAHGERALPARVL